MAANERSATDASKGWRNRLRFWVIFLATVSAFGIFTWLQFRPRIHPQFIAASYTAPEGCEKRIYNIGEMISIACAVERYRFDQWREYRLPPPGGPLWIDGKWKGGYYRIGNDLVGFSCSSLGEVRCMIKAVESNVYSVKN